MSDAQVRNAPINIRALPKQRNLIDKAASLRNQSRSDFMLEAAYREAENVLLDQRLFLLDEKSFQVFNEILDQPVSDNQALQELLNSQSPWEK